MKLNHLLTAATLSAALLIGGITLTAQTPAAAPPPTKLAVVNIVDVFNRSNMKIDGDTQLENLSKDLQDQRRKMQAKVDELGKTIEELKKDSPDYKVLSEDLMKKAMELQAFSQYTEQKLLLEQRLMTAKIYRAINDTIANYSRANGVALVLVSDSPEIAGARNQAELLSRITNRKVIYAHEQLDITRAITEKMNTDFKLGTTGTGVAPK